jgi:Zn-dependent protease
VFIIINIVLMVFNLLPIPPLDGGHVMEMMLPWHLRDRFRRFAPYGILILLVLLWFGALRYIISFFMYITYSFIGLGFGENYLIYLFGS